MLLSEVVEDTDQIYGLIKFTSYIDSFLSGTVYMNNLKTYIELEEKTGKKGMGDKLEAARVHSDVGFEMFLSGTDQLIARGTAEQISIRRAGDELSPVYCMFAIHANNLVIVDEDDEYYTTKINLTENEIERLIKEFGENMVLTDAKFFIEKLEQELIRRDYSYKAKIVKYDDYGINHSDRINAYENDSNDIYFWKDKRFAHQHEYRIVLTDQFFREGLPVEIGDISEKSCVFNARDFFGSFGARIKKQ